MNAVIAWMMAGDLIPEPARDCFLRRCLTNRWCSLVRLSGKLNDDVSLECVHQLVRRTHYPGDRSSVSNFLTFGAVCPGLARGLILVILIILYQVAYFVILKRIKIMYNNNSKECLKNEPLADTCATHRDHYHTVTNRAWPWFVLRGFFSTLFYLQMQSSMTSPALQGEYHTSLASNCKYLWLLTYLTVKIFLLTCPNASQEYKVFRWF